MRLDTVEDRGKPFLRSVQESGSGPRGAKGLGRVESTMLRAAPQNDMCMDQVLLLLDPMVYQLLQAFDTFGCRNSGRLGHWPSSSELRFVVYTRHIAYNKCNTP